MNVGRCGTRAWSGRTSRVDSRGLLAGHVWHIGCHPWQEGRIVETHSPEPSLDPGTPAVIVVQPPTASLEVVALTVLDRLIVTFHRAGAGRITVVLRRGETLPDVRRARALGIRFEVVERLPALAGRVVVSGTGWWATREDVTRGFQAGGRWTDGAGRELGAGVLEGTSEDWIQRLASLPEERLGPSACVVRDVAGAAVASERLWAGLGSSADGRVDRWFNRPLGRWLLSRHLVRTAVTPNQVSLAATAMGLGAGALFCVPGTTSAVVAALVFQASAVVDCVDGDLARAVFKESRLGKWIDLVGDQVVHAAVFAGIATGLGRGSMGPLAWVLGGMAVLGAVLSFWMVVRGTALGGERGGRVQRFMDGATNRDFSVLVLALACTGSLEWFLWMAAVGGHGFWVVAWILQRQAMRSLGSGRRKTR